MTIKLQPTHCFLHLGFTLCRAEQPLRGMELQEKEAPKDYSIQEMFRKNLEPKDVC